MVNFVEIDESLELMASCFPIKKPKVQQLQDRNAQAVHRIFVPPVDACRIGGCRLADIADASVEEESNPRTKARTELEQDPSMHIFLTSCLST